jgi:nucleotide-binding universal stress UspA family protein
VETHVPGRLTERAPVPSIQCITVAVLGSLSDHAAIATARVLAARLEGELVLVHEAGLERSPLHAGATASAQGRLGLAEAIAAARALGVRARDLPITAPSAAAAEAVPLAVQDVGAGLVVVGLPPPGAAPSAHWTLAALAERAPAPVLLVRPAALGERTYDGPRAGAGGADVPLHPLHLIAGLDGSAGAETLLPTLAELARAGEIVMTLVRAMPSNVVLYCAQCGAVAAQQVAISYLQRMALELQAAGVVPAAIRTVARFGDLADALRDLAVREHASILIAPGHPVGRRLLASGMPPMPRGRPEAVLPAASPAEDQVFRDLQVRIGGIPDAARVRQARTWGGTGGHAP